MGELLFKDKLNVMPCQNWQHILSLPFSWDENVLCLLFFPTNADIADGNLNVKYLQLPMHYTQVSTSLPFMAESHDIQNLRVKTQCPGFLKVMSDAEYCDIFETLLFQPQLLLTTWEDLQKWACDTQKIVTNLLSHVMTWYTSDWKFPE